jgi:hypothetical protein
LVLNSFFIIEGGADPASKSTAPPQPPLPQLRTRKSVIKKHKINSASAWASLFSLLFHFFLFFFGRCPAPGEGL